MADLTGWDLGKIRRNMNLKPAATPATKEDEAWWEKIWPGR